MKMTKLKHYKKLKRLGKKPFDLTDPKIDFLERAKNYQISFGPWTMYYPTERVDDTVLENLCEMAKEAKVFQKMQHVQEMKVMNYIKGYPSENRRVGHTAIRSLRCKNHSGEAIKAQHAYAREMEKLEEFCSKAHHFKNVIVVGIGGSYLGTEAVYKSLQAYQKNDKKLFFASNIDPDKLTSILNDIKLKQTLILVISKSGGTLEIHAQEEFLRKTFHEEGLDAKDHFVAVTMKDSPMDRAQDFVQIFYLHDYIGGRYSVSSMVGAVPLSIMLGFQVFKEFLEGMHAMDHHALEEKNPRKNLPLMGALLGIWNRNFLHQDTYAIIPYSQAMSHWSAHLQQLFMESNGKMVCQEDGSFLDYDTCPVVWGTVGTEGQHSYYQCIHQGTKTIPLEFIGFRECQYHHDKDIDGTTNQQKLLSNLFAQSITLAKGHKVDNPNKTFMGNRPSHILLADKLDPYTLGALLAYHEHFVAFQGFIWGINSFDQEGVQLGKVAANSIIKMFEEYDHEGELKHKDKDPLQAFYVQEVTHHKRTKHKKSA